MLWLMLLRALSAQQPPHIHSLADSFLSFLVLCGCVRVWGACCKPWFRLGLCRGALASLPFSRSVT